MYSIWLLSLFLDCRGPLLWRGLGRGWSLNVFAITTWRQRTLIRRAALRGWRRTLDVLLPWTYLPWLCLPSLLSRCRRSLYSVPLKVLADCRFTRLVTVMPAA